MSCKLSNMSCKLLNMSCKEYKICHVKIIYVKYMIDVNRNNSMCADD